jgi:hypothetical protein
MSLKLRVRSRWRDKRRERSLDDNATSLAYAIWEIALAATKNLHAEDFRYDDDAQRVGVLAEYLIFLSHAADRLVFGRLAEAERPAFMRTLATQVARHYQRNLEEILDRADYRGDFIEKLNARNLEYAETSFENGRPGYQALRVLGEKIQDVMGMSQTNRWAIQQVMDLDAPETLRHLRRALDDLLGTSGTDFEREQAPGTLMGPD